jgi:hypothetical protein
MNLGFGIGLSNPSLTRFDVRERSHRDIDVHDDPP